MERHGELRGMSRPLYTVVAYCPATKGGKWDKDYRLRRRQGSASGDARRQEGLGINPGRRWSEVK